MQDLKQLDVSLEQMGFLGDTLVSLASRLEETVGLKGASAFIGEVGTEIGTKIGETYIEALGETQWDPATLSQVLVDLKRRIGGGFSVESVSDEELVLTNTRCPFAERVEGRASLCMMTTTVFGSISARTTGYASVQIEDTLAMGDKRCRVRVRLKRVDGCKGHEFYGSLE